MVSSRCCSVSSSWRNGRSRGSGSSAYSSESNWSSTASLGSRWRSTCACWLSQSIGTDTGQASAARILRLLCAGSSGIAFDMTDSAKARAPILAAGGILLWEGSRPRIAVVRLRRDKAWVLPKGKLYPGEQALAAAKREVLEETGHKVSVHEFLGSMSYPVAGKIKIVQFWRMRAMGGPVRELTHDVKAVKWLPLKQALDTLTRAHEKVFL